MVRTGHRFILTIGFLLAAAPLLAQEPAGDRIRALEEKLDALLRQAEELRQELAQLKGAQPAPEDDLTQVGVVAPEAPPQPSLADVTTVTNVPTPGASKVFNPDIAVIGNFFGKAGRENPFEGEEPRASMEMEEAELSFEAYIDPYAKAKFFLAATPEGLEVEEGYAQFITLPWDLTVKAGKFRSLFGKANLWHTHVRPWADQPLMIHNFFGDEALADSGISVSRLLPNDAATMELTAEVFRGEAENVFEPVNRNDLFYNTHFKLFRDLTENSNIEVGASYARGTLGEAGHSRFAGVDVTYRWKPLQQGRYRGFIARFEGLVNDRPEGETGRGYYASADYQFARRWIAGVRLDSASNPRFASSGRLPRDRGLSAIVTFRPSEFSQIRTQLRQTRYGAFDEAVNELLFQLQFSIGAHGAHTF